MTSAALPPKSSERSEDLARAACTSSSPRSSLAGFFFAARRAAAQHGVEVLLDLGLDRPLNAPSEQAEPRGQVERVGLDDETAVDAGARELDDVARLAFDHGALHAELLLGRLGPLPGRLARLGEAEAMAAVDVDVGHGRSVVEGAAVARA